jgi:molybdopterin-binding protein
VPAYRLSEVARLVGVSDDTVRRWVDSERLSSSHDAAGRLTVDGVDLAALMSELAATEHGVEGEPIVAASARNRFAGLVTRVVRDTVMAQVEIQAGPHRVVSLLSREAADELGLEVGVLAVASVKSTNVVVELPRARG